MLFLLTPHSPMKKWILLLFNTYVPAVVWTLLVLGLMCTPGKDLPDLGDWAELIKLDKWVHALLFGTSTVLFMLPLLPQQLPIPILRQRFLKITFAICTWGFCTECIQYFWVTGRTFDLYDALADAFGAFVAYFIAKKYLINPEITRDPLP